MSPGPVPRWGDDFLAIGFPASVEGSPPKPRPTPRLFKGHFQRIFEHESDFGFSYLAGELSMPAPHGLSGGPVFSLQRGRVLGVVAENLETTNLRHSQETVEEDGSTTRVERLGVINYGICVMVQAIEAWAEEIIEREGPMYARPGRRDSR
jgi:hypothetical protein